MVDWSLLPPGVEGVVRAMARSAEPMSKLNLTVPEMHLYMEHLNNLAKGGYKQPGGQTSTLIQMGVDPPEGDASYQPAVNIPSLWNLQPGNEQRARAIAFKRYGPGYWPSYPNFDVSEARYNQMHDVMAKDIGETE